MASNPRMTTASALISVALALAVTGCGSTASSGSSSPTPTPTQTSTPTPSPTAAAPGNPAAARTQVEQDWVKFFSPKTSLADKTTLLENGQQLQQLVQSFANDPRVGQVEASVQNVQFTSPTGATVTYTLSLKGTPVLPNASGTSVLQNNVWKVSDKSLCSLIALDTSAPKAPGC
ncbi:hypothetical protein NGB36_22270 [Streptomyces sp. RB6PN25]|uniref:Low molecular weight antigen MTB12-like C-terminal domain-containing protein n=1 Tax=Streptomyces humicola TaxID=2953240 RepID=A0ABT1Q001_9ACTN|nr:hypothetical protein [Streptomyces humicola]MCQ4083253.1 hypothetical protein [Streptomyces humicola]